MPVTAWRCWRCKQWTYITKANPSDYTFQRYGSLWRPVHRGTCPSNERNEK